MGTYEKHEKSQEYLTLKDKLSSVTGSGLRAVGVNDKGVFYTLKNGMIGKLNQLTSGGIVKLYTEGNTERVKTTVPDLKGVSLGQATIMLRSKNLNIASDGSGIVISQDPKAGTEVDEGSIINVNLQEATDSSQH
jgi:stage V sporulation protein D (sporulation-specific penicillin-binding protein)